MPSRAERPRVAFEWLARGIGLAALAVLLWSMTRPVPPAAPGSVAGDDVGAALRRLTLKQPADSVHLTLDVAPDATNRDWMLALRRSGTGISWYAPSVPAIAIAAEPVADPRGRTRVTIAAPRDASIRIGDDVGAIDTANVSGHGASVIAATIGRAQASLGPHRAAAHPEVSIVLKRVLVIGSASWESRFVLAALEERGWQVDARLAVAPGVVVRQGAAAALDTSRYAVVVALDTTAASEAPAIVRFVRSGGGLVLAGEAARVPALARIAPGAPQRRWQPTVRLAAQPASRTTLGYFPIRDLADDAVTLERADGGVAVAAHRFAAGRVVQLGYDETWRLRMTGGENGPGDHRAWWGGLVTAAAFAPLVREPSTPLPALGDAAPLASLVAALGPPRDAAHAASASRGRPVWVEPIAFALVILSFLAEWASRRLRGAA